VEGWCKHPTFEYATSARLWSGARDQLAGRERMSAAITPTSATTPAPSTVQDRGHSASDHAVEKRWPGDRGLYGDRYRRRAKPRPVLAIIFQMARWYKDALIL
jgi:hypothetical protein